MDDIEQESRERRVERAHWCFLIDERASSAVFWGLVFLVVGAVWLAANVADIEDWGEWVIPVLLVAVGARMLIDRTVSARR